MKFLLSLFILAVSGCATYPSDPPAKQTCLQTIAIFFERYQEDSNFNVPVYFGGNMYAYMSTSHKTEDLIEVMILARDLESIKVKRPIGQCRSGDRNLNVYSYKTDKKGKVK